MKDTITILRSLNGRLAKVWRADGTIEAYQSAFKFEVEEREVDGVKALSDLLTLMAKEPTRCVIRGQWNPNAPEENTRRSTRRLNVCFDDKPRRWLALDVDQFEPLTADPILHPAEAAREFVVTMLPPEFQDAAFHLQLSNSAGAPGKAHVLKAHLWFWLSEAVTGAQLTAWQKRTGARFDPAFFRQVQINYTADPVFDGCSDPVPLREMFVDGAPEVTLNLEADDLAAEVRASRFDASGAEGDDVSAWLDENWTVLGGDSKGHVWIECPFADEHGSAGSESSTVYMPNGNGYEQGHFKCLHGHCEGRADTEFLGAMGYVAARAEEFPLIETPKGETAERLMPAFARDKQGRIEPTATNLKLALDRPDLIGLDIRFDEFQRQLVMAEDYAPADWRLFVDADYQELVLRLEAIGFKPVGRQAAKDAAKHRADRTPVDTAMVWADTLTWDGVPRIDTFLSDRFDVEDRPYHRAVSRYAWTAMAGRLLSPGCQADMVPILLGGQGARKSSGLEALVPSEHHRLMNFNQPEEARSRLMRGALVIELAELNGLKTRALEEIKAWITRRREEWIPKYEEFFVSMGRRCLFWGTTNDGELFDDPTGERRWLPVLVGAQVDVEGIAASRDQMWAEAIAKWKTDGIAWREAETLARAEHGAYRVHDTWEEALRLWGSGALLDGASPSSVGFTTREALVEGLCFTDKGIKRADEMRCAKALKSAGFAQIRERRAGSVARLWKGVTTCDDLA